MKRKRYTEEQISFCLRQRESGTPVAEIVPSWGFRNRRSTAGGRSLRGWAWPRSAGSRPWSKYYLGVSFYRAVSC